jgi:hypothetical protein
MIYFISRFVRNRIIISAKLMITEIMATTGIVKNLALCRQVP